MHKKKPQTKSSQWASLESLSKSFVNISKYIESISSAPYPQVLSSDILIATLWIPKEEARVWLLILISFSRQEATAKKWEMPQDTVGSKFMESIMKTWFVHISS